jgi:hypothetical protein
MNVYETYLLPNSRFLAFSYANIFGTSRTAMMDFILWEIFSGFIFLSLLAPIALRAIPSRRKTLVYIALIGQAVAFIFFSRGDNLLPPIVIGLGASPAFLLFMRSIRPSNALGPNGNDRGMIEGGMIEGHDT